MAERKLSVVLDLDTSRWSGKLSGAAGEVRTFGGVIKSAGSEANAFSGHMGRVGSSMQTPMARFRDLVVILGQARSAFLTLKDVSVGWLGAIFKQAGELERLQVLMEGLSKATDTLGKKNEATKNLSELYKMARSSGFAIQELTDSFVKIKSGGIDPMNGAMRGLVDATAAFGGNSETLHRASIAIQQMAGKGVISMEELRQQLGEAVPSAIRLMADSMDQTIPELVKAISKGTVAAKPALAGMFAEMERVYHGAGKRLADTLFGQMAQIKTNFAQLTADFTGMGQKDGFFSEMVAKVKELNAAMRSNEARAWLASVGQGVSNIAVMLVNAIQTIASFRNEIFFVAKVLGTLWIANTAVAGFMRLKGVVVDAIAALRNFRWATLGIAQSTIEQLKYNSAVALGRAVALESAAAEAGRARALADVAVAEEAAATFAMRRAQVEMRSANTIAVGLRAQQLARRNLVVSMEAEQMAALNSIQTGRNEAGQYVNRAEAMATYQSSVTRLATARSMLERTDIALAGAEETLARATAGAAAAQDVAALATTTATAAVEREAVAVAADTVAKTIWMRATAMAAAASTAFGAAVSVALGPIGIMIMILYQAASAAGVFESAADQATAAAKRMAQGFREAGDAARVATQRAALAKERTDLEGDMGKIVSTATKAGSWKKAGVLYFTDEARKARMAAIDAQDKELTKGQTDGVKSSFRNRQNEWFTHLNDDRDRYLDRLTVAYNREKALGKRSAKDLRDTYDSKVAAFDKKQQGNMAAITPKGGNTVEAAARRAAYRQLLESRNPAGNGADASPVGKGGGKGKDFGDAMATAAGNVAKLKDQLAGGKGNLAQFNAEVAAGSSKYKAWNADQLDAMRGQMALKDALQQSKSAMGGTDPNKAFDTKLQTTAGRIAEISDELIGGKGNLEKFNAELAAGKYDGVTKGRIEQMREYAKILDGLEHKKDVKATTDKLDDELAKAATASSGLWDSLNAGTMEADKRLTQITSRFAGLTDGLKGDDLDKVQKLIDAIVANLNKADAATITDGWETATAKITNDLMDVNTARQRNFEDEVLRQQALIALTAQGSEERKRMETAFANWKKAEGQRVARDNEGATVKMMRDWANMGQNIDKVMSQAIGTLVDGLGDANFNIAKFAGDIIKQLLKIMLQAIIAYGILSALGMTPTGSGGQKLSLGGFMKQQMGGAMTSMGGGPSYGANVPGGAAPSLPRGTVSVEGQHVGGAVGSWAQSFHNVNPSIFARAEKYHTGGFIGERPLMPGEHPIIAKEKELMLTEQQQDLLGRRLAGAGGQPPAVKIEFINNTGRDANAETSEPTFDGKEWVIGVVVDAARKQGPMREMMKGIKG